LLRTIMYQLGFTSSGLWMAFLLLPVGATVLSLLLLPLATAAIAGMNPRRHLSEAGFQREVATRITAVLMIPPLLTVAALPITVLLGVPQPWSGIGAGPLTALALAVVALQLTWVSIRGWRSEEHTSELQSRFDLVCRLLLEKKKKQTQVQRQ